MKKAATSFLSAELPEDCKFYLADTKDDLHKVSIRLNIEYEIIWLPSVLHVCSFENSVLILYSSNCPVHVAFQGAASFLATLEKPEILCYV